MALNETHLGQIEALLARSAPDAELVGSLRRLLSGLSVTRCEASDVADEAPFRVFRHASLYLVDGSDHCWRLTSDPSLATGIVVASNGTGQGSAP
jgi:hypothetical protein